MENTVGSRYYKNEQKRDAQVQERILSMKNRLSQYSEQEKKSALMKVDSFDTFVLRIVLCY